MGEITGVLKAKAGNGKGFLVEGHEGWFNASDTVAPYLSKIEKGETVTVIFEQKGVKQVVVKVSKVANVEVKETEKESFKEKEQKPRSSYVSNDDKTAQIQRGNALNAAGAAISGNFAGADPDAVAEALIMIAERALTWLRAE